MSFWGSQSQKMLISAIFGHFPQFSEALAQKLKMLEKNPAQGFKKIVWRCSTPNFRALTQILKNKFIFPQN